MLIEVIQFIHTFRMDTFNFNSSIVLNSISNGKRNTSNYLKFNHLIFVLLSFYKFNKFKS